MLKNSKDTYESSGARLAPAALQRSPRLRLPSRRLCGRPLTLLRLAAAVWSLRFLKFLIVHTSVPACNSFVQVKRGTRPELMLHHALTEASPEAPLERDPGKSLCVEGQLHFVYRKEREGEGEVGKTQQQPHNIVESEAERGNNPAVKIHLHIFVNREESSFPADRSEPVEGTGRLTRRWSAALLSVTLTVHLSVEEGANTSHFRTTDEVSDWNLGVQHQQAFGPLPWTASDSGPAPRAVG
ncbi:hypothetical protein EYF80_001931 [Liparis tanakae]|uniref:Uncharacterized protein n=1 Tax=Liparis tanakae TaxID=230148 RepID=A0A4Z2JDB3_9TELE|nr:hypothetical protein EYF80_001931 [Liparis tanakae]